MNSESKGLIKTPELKKEIPMSWFNGTGSRSKGIMKVYFSQEFMNQAHGEISNYFFMDGEMDNTRIKDMISFTKEELTKKLAELELKYKGKTEAPFEIRFY